jgi:hypothetical protein
MVCSLPCPTGESLDFLFALASLHAFGAEKTHARKIQFRFSVQADLGCPVPLAKIFLFRIFENRDLFTPFRAGKRGVSRSSRTWRGMRWTRMCRKTSGIDADGEVVWSWRALAGAKQATMLTHRAGNGGKRWFTEESAE